METGILGEECLATGNGEENTCEEVIVARADEYCAVIVNINYHARMRGIGYSRATAREGSKARKIPGNFAMLTIPVTARSMNQMNVTIHVG